MQDRETTHVVSQEIERITVALETVVEVESGDSEFRSNQTFGTQEVTGALTVGPGDALEFPFSLPVPWETPLTHIGGQGLRGVSMGVRTELTVARGIDRGDLDPVQVHALAGQQALIDALEALGCAPVGSAARRATLLDQLGVVALPAPPIRDASRGRLRAASPG